MIILILWIVIFGLLLYFEGTNTLLYTPVLVVLQTISWQIVSYSQTIDRGIILSNYLLMLFLIILSSIKIVKNKHAFGFIHKIIILWVILLLIQSFISSSDVWESIKRSMHIIASLMVLLGILSTRFNEHNYLIARKQVYYFLIIFSANIVFLSIFDLGEPFYEKLLGKSTYTAPFLRGGWFTVYSMHGVAIITALLPFMNKLKPKVIGIKWSIIIYIVTASILILTFKRTYFLILAFGMLSYLLFTLYISRRNFFISLLIILLTTSFSFLAFDTFKASISTRSKILSVDEFVAEGRFIEFATYPNVVNDEGVVFLLFGRELFVSAGKFKALEQAERGRFLHNDFSHLIYGTGLIGLLTYLFIFYTLYAISKKYYINKMTTQNRYMFYGIIIIITTTLISGTGDGILTMINRVVPFYLIALYLSIMRDYTPSNSNVNLISNNNISSNNT